VTATQSAQPHWVTPLVTVTPRLEQEFRTDFVRQTNAKREDTWNLGNSKGLRSFRSAASSCCSTRHRSSITIPEPKTASATCRSTASYAFLSRNEEHGNYILTAYLAATVPTGKNGNGSCCGR